MGVPPIVFGMNIARSRKQTFSANGATPYQLGHRLASPQEFEFKTF